MQQGGREAGVWRRAAGGPVRAASAAPHGCSWAERGGSHPLLSAGDTRPGSVPGSRLPVLESPLKGYGVIRGQENLIYGERQRELRQFSLEKRGLKGYPASLRQYLVAKSKGDRA